MGGGGSEEDGVTVRQGAGGMARESENDFVGGSEFTKGIAVDPEDLSVLGIGWESTLAVETL